MGLHSVRRRLLTRLALTALLIGCGADADRERPPSPCDGSLAEGEVQVLATGFQKSEGLAFSPDGRLFVTADDAIVEIQPDGSWEVVVDWPGGVGLAWWGDRLMAAGREGNVGIVGAVDVDTLAIEVLTRDTPKSNFLTVTPWNSLLVADDDVMIWEMGPTGVTAPWLEINGANGMAFTDTGDALWAVNTWDQPAPAWQIELAGTTAGTVNEIFAWPAGNFPDGVALGASGDLYTSLNITGLISRLSADGTERTVASGLDFTASIAFGNHDRWDRCAVYSTSLFGSEIYVAGVGEPGLPVPY